MRNRLIALVVLILTFRAVAADPPMVRLEPFLAKLKKPIGLLTDGTTRMFILEQDGKVYTYENGQRSAKPWLDLSKKVNVGYECGLLCIAFHPDYQKNGLFYVDQTRMAPTLKTFIAEYKVDPKAEAVDLATERILLTIDQPFENHNGGQLQFGPDGYLYIGMGDGGSMHDPNNNAQNPKSLLGKILRIDVNAKEGYAIPKGNPFANDASYRPEIWSLGMRNPWRFSFDSATGLLYEGDVGQDIWEEVNIIEKGGNYGWRIREGAADLHPVPNPPKMIDPIFQYNHNKTAASITGGMVYHGKAIPALEGYYIFGDYSLGKVWGIKYDPAAKKVVSEVLLINPADPNLTGGQRATQPSSFGQDAAGEIYLCDITFGNIFKIVRR
jgi:glucose/arabinose dehydrogenase